ncbi:MAG: PD-(D/E)XK nuclease-like domain-containing protein [Candidatus Heimdallarchaeota archaeon]
MFGRVKIEPGQYHPTNEEYQSWDAANVSLLKDIARSEYYAFRRNEEGLKSKALTMGSLLDCLLLTPELFKSEYVIKPLTYPSGVDYPSLHGKENKTWSGNAKWCKAWMAEKEEHGFKIVSNSMLEEVKKINLNLRRHPRANDLLSGLKQTAYVWRDLKSGILCKCLIDVVGENVNGLVDLKSTSDASQFRNNLTKFDYHAQAAHYVQGHFSVTKPDEPFIFDWVVVETTFPYDVATYSCRDESLRNGIALIDKWLEKYKVMEAKYEKYLHVVEEIKKIEPNARLIPEKYYYPISGEIKENKRVAYLKENPEFCIPPESSIYSGYINEDVEFDNYDINIDVFPYKLKNPEDLVSDLWTSGIPGGEKYKDQWEKLLKEATDGEN